MEKILSIIVPTYNVSAYLSDCLQSVAGKYEDEIEILVIDDGSTDDSGVIADWYAEKYSNITAYHKKNGGLSDARNYGLLRAKGKYVFFLDSDDMVDSTEFMKAAEKLTSFEGDALLWDLGRVNETGSPLGESYNSYYVHNGVEPWKVCTGAEIIRQQLVHHRDYLGVVVQGAFRREMLISSQFWFEPELLHEDELWTPRVLLNCAEVIYIPARVYQYRVRDNSITTGSKHDREKHLMSLTYIFKALCAYLDWKIMDRQFAELIKANLVRRYLHKVSVYNAFSYPAAAAQIPRVTVLRFARGIKDRGRAAILLLSGKLYCALTNRTRE